MAEQSVIRLGFLGRVGTTEEAVGRIGSISPTSPQTFIEKAW